MTFDITIIITVYNNESSIQQTVDSVLAQTFLPRQLIVVDDGSTDGTEAILAAYSDKIEYIWQEKGGKVAARNRGLWLAQHEFVLFLDAGDWVLPSKLQQQTAVLQLHPSLSFVISNWQRAEPPDLDWWLRLRPFPLGTILFRRLWLNSVAGFSAAAGLAQANDLMLRLCLAGATGAWLDQPTISQQEPNLKMHLQHAEATMDVLDNFFSRPELPDGLKAQQNQIYFEVTLRLAWALFEQDDVKTAVTYLQQNMVLDDPLAQLSPENRITAWLFHFEQWRQENCRSSAIFSTLWPHFEAVAPGVLQWPDLHRLANYWLADQPEAIRSAFSSRQLWQIFKLGLTWEPQDESLTAEDGLTWWAAVWRQFCQHPIEDSVADWTHFSALDQFRFLQLVRFGLAVAPEGMTTARLSLLWREAQMHGLLTEPDFTEFDFFAALTVGSEWRPRSLGEGAVRQPKVSVIIPVYNGARYIAETVTSVLNQTYTDFELIVVDDGSTDETVPRLRPFHGQIRLIQQENKGVSAARNHGLKLALGDFVLFVDGDDCLLPEKLTKQVACLQENHLLGAVHSGWQLVDEYGRSLRNITPWHNAPDLTLQDWLRWKPVFLGAMLFRRRWLCSIDGFDTNFRQAEDTDFLLRLSLAGCPMIWLKEITIQYRQHGNSVTQNGQQQAEDLSGVINNFFENEKLPTPIQQIEGKIRQHTFIWLVWQLYRTNYHEDIVFYLQESAQRMGHVETAVIVQSWLVQLVEYAWDEGFPLTQLTEFFPHIQRALQLKDAAWYPLEKLLQWWLVQWEYLNQGHWENLAQIQQIVYSGLLLQQAGHVSLALEWVEWWLTVWRFFLNSEESVANQGIQKFTGKSTHEIIKLAQASILHQPNCASVSQIATFWAKAQADGLIPMEERHKISTLYLTYFGQAFLGKRWKDAAIGLVRALGHSWHPQGMRAWWQFMVQGMHYFKNGR
ncbi:MAG: glycosyltransferase family 2 protein [Chloroflexi bacterium]|nr:glycosyltransferase family 2 protein [Chloroflexota bacterium]